VIRPVRLHRGPGRFRRIRHIGPLRRLRLLRVDRRWWRRRQLRPYGPGGRWPLGSGYLGLVGLRDVRLLRLRDVRRVGDRIGPSLVTRAMEDILQLVPLPGINGRDRFGIHNDRNKK
jgi:hypothetical protein